MRRNFLLGALLLIALTAPSFPRILANWNYDRLFGGSDVVVIARAVSTADTPAKASDPRYAGLFVGQDTTFKVEHVLQGRLAQPMFVLKHFRMKDHQELSEGPLLVSFRDKPLVLRRTVASGDVSLGIPAYLLFMRQSPDGTFVPVSGEVDPELSVKEIWEPLPRLIEHDAGDKGE
jgi:hypothetical protein